MGPICQPAASGRGFAQALSVLEVPCREVQGPSQFFKKNFRNHKTRESENFPGITREYPRNFLGLEPVGFCSDL